MASYQRSTELLQRARKVMPGGVNSPVRAYRAVEAFPPFIKKGWGCRLEDVDGNIYIDYVGSWGPLVLGHSHPAVQEAIIKAAKNGTSFGAPTEAEVLFAEKITELMPGLEEVRLVSSGTEATMSALRLARGYTGRDILVKFDGCYHGHGDAFLVAAGSGLATLGIPSSPGVPAPVAELTISVPYNDLAAATEVFKQNPQKIAAVIVEPIAANMGVVLPEPGFLEGLQKLCQQQGSLLIFDEVITGFRVNIGGAQALYNIKPDLTTLGKIIGGGLPLAVYGGRRDILEQMAPQGPVYQAGTLSGNPLATAAGLAVLVELSKPGVYPTLHEISDKIYHGLGQLFRQKGLPHYGQAAPGMFTYFMQNGPVINYRQAGQSDLKLFARFFRAMLEQGIYLAPSQFEATMISLAHDQSAIEQTLEAAQKALQRL